MEKETQDKERLKKQTIDTYNKSADALTSKFNNQSRYEGELDKIFALVKKQDPFVLEIGCGNGRDAKDILKRTNNYLGMDISEKFIEIAKLENPEAKFEIADIENYKFKIGIDIVLAFASLIHVPKENLRKILSDIYGSMSSGGIFLATLKFSPKYSISTKEDDFGIRTYFLYSMEDIKEISGQFDIFALEPYVLRGQEWFKVILKKR